jgi:hypothetical protein
MTALRSPTGRFVLAVLGVYTLLRLVTTAILLWITYAEQDPVIFTDEYPRYFDLAVLWDGKWYQRIALEGYPSELPRDELGQVQQNPWAFYPVFPFLGRAVMALTGLPFPVAATLVATVLGYAAALVMAFLIRERVGDAAAIATVALFAAFPAAPTLQVAYTESLATLLLGVVLWLLARERWVAAGSVALLTGLARPIALPLGVVALVAVALRWRRRATDPVTRSDLVGMLTALAGCGLSGLVWPAIVWWGTGEPDGYTSTMSAWRGGQPVQPFAPTLGMTRYLFGDVGPWLLLAAGVLLVVAVVGPWAHGLGAELRAWCLAYPFYLAAALDPWTSIYRYLIVLFPLFTLMVGGGWPPGTDRRPRWLLPLRTVVVVLLFIGWQVWWSWELFRFEPPSDNPP